MPGMVRICCLFETVTLEGKSLQQSCSTGHRLSLRIKCLYDGQTGRHVLSRLIRDNKESDNSTSVKTSKTDCYDPDQYDDSPRDPAREMVLVKEHACEERAYNDR